MQAEDHEVCGSWALGLLRLRLPLFSSSADKGSRIKGSRVEGFRGKGLGV